MYSEILASEKSVVADKKVKISIAKGDGIGPEIMEAVLHIMDKAGAQIEPDFIEVGESVYLSGNSAGIDDDAWESISKNKIILKAPITTPQGSGYKSLNVTLRKSLGLFANVRPVAALHPYVTTNFPEMDVVVIRENEEDLYAGIEHRQTEDVVQCLKLITRPGCERIVRYAFEYAKAYNRKKVTCMVKDNIMKLTDGMFHRVFKEIGEEYPDIKQEVQIIDIGSARLAAKPEQYDVVVTSNLYGDIVSDIVAEIAGSVGMAGSANVGTEVAMFEAIHGSAPDIAGRQIANPSGLLNAAVMMLAHIGQTSAADRIRNAWLRTIEDGYHTADIYDENTSVEKVSTIEFADEVVARLGLMPEKLPVSNLAEGKGNIEIPVYERKVSNKSLVGVDVFLDWTNGSAEDLGKQLDALGYGEMKLKMITNRGVKVYPQGNEATFCTDHWRCRFVSSDSQTSNGTLIYDHVESQHIIGILSALVSNGFDVIKTENLYEFDGQRGFSLGQGE